MAYADPQTITINAIANTLARTGFGPNAGSFSKDDGTVKLAVSHAYNKRTRRSLRVDHSKYVSDILVPANSVLASMSCYMVVDTPLAGYTIAEAKQVIDGFTAYLTASSGANVTKLLGGEV